MLVVGRKHGGVGRYVRERIQAAVDTIAGRKAPFVSGSVERQWHGKK